MIERKKSRRIGKLFSDESVETDHVATYLSLGLCMGIAFGAAFDNVAVGMALGMSIGVAVGSVIAEREKKKNPDRTGTRKKRLFQNKQTRNGGPSARL